MKKKPGRPPKQQQAPVAGPVRFTGGVEKLCEVDVEDLAAYVVKNFKPEEWHKNPDKPYVRIDNWMDWQNRSDAVVAIAEIMGHFPGCNAVELAISVVHPGDYVAPHTDSTSDNWLTRIHIPLVTNPGAFLIYPNIREDVKYHLEVGMAYQVNIAVPHAVVNGGNASRIHLMFDVVK